jgi:phage terminase Nu1 subunit (DNA packaging protein)
VQGLFDNMGLLVGWKAISKYLRRSISTVKRYQKRGLPIIWGPSGRPMALKYELDRFHVLFTQKINEMEREANDQKG